MTKEIIDHYSKDDYEDKRTCVGVNRFEYERTKEIIGRYLDPEKPVILDIGGATGAYSFWLAGTGYKVHLIDITPRHIELAQINAENSGVQLESMNVGDSRSLPFENHFADMVLLMGPMYHLTEPTDRVRSLEESKRVLKTGGRIFCAAISRYASILDGFRSHLFKDPVYEKIADQDFIDGQHRNLDNDKPYFTTSFFHKPEDLRQEIEDAGLVCEKIIGVEGPLVMMEELNKWIDERGHYYKMAFKYMKMIEEEESLIGASFHLLAIATKQ